jgi:predicted transcriptional regulator
MPISEYIKERASENFKGRVKKRRGRAEITADILSAAMRETKKTQVVYKANINFRRARRYFPFLEEKGLIENIGNEYKTTEKGKRFLRDYQKLDEQLK